MNLLVTGAFAHTEKDIETLKTYEQDVVFMKYENEKLPCKPDWVEGIIGNGIFLNHPIEQFTSLKYIQLTSAGFDRVPMDYVREHNIKIFNAKGVYSVPMAEFAICGVLQLYKQSKYFFNNQKEHKWIKHRGIQELQKKTVGIVGCGSVGIECAKRFKAFNCKIVGVDITSYDSEYFDEMFASDEFDKILKISDVLVLTLPLTEETKGMMNVERFEKMRDGAILVNIARGAIINTKALIASLKEKLFGAVLDVFEEEPLKEESLLWNMENVIITPHNSFVGEGNHERLESLTLRNLELQR